MGVLILNGTDILNKLNAPRSGKRENAQAPFEAETLEAETSFAPHGHGLNENINCLLQIAIVNNVLNNLLFSMPGSPPPI